MHAMVGVISAARKVRNLSDFEIYSLSKYYCRLWSLEDEEEIIDSKTKNNLNN